MVPLDTKAKLTQTSVCRRAEKDRKMHDISYLGGLSRRAENHVGYHSLVSQERESEATVNVAG